MMENFPQPCRYIFALIIILLLSLGVTAQVKKTSKKARKTVVSAGKKYFKKTAYTKPRRPQVKRGKINLANKITGLPVTATKTSEPIEVNLAAICPTAEKGLTGEAPAANNSVEQIPENASRPDLGSVLGTIFFTDKDGRDFMGFIPGSVITLTSAQKKIRISSNEQSDFFPTLPVGHYCIDSVESESGTKLKIWPGQHLCFDIKKDDTTRVDIAILK